MEVATAAPHRNPKAKVFLNGVAGAFAKLGYNLIADRMCLVWHGRSLLHHRVPFLQEASRKVSKW
jgi:hypothetical protein